MITLNNHEQCPECERFSNRGVSVDPIVIRDGKILLVRRGVDPFKGYWGTPGGYNEWDETLEETVKREVKEETNMDVIKAEQMKVYSHPSRHPKQTITVAFLVEVGEGEPVAGDDAEEAEWFSLDELPANLAFDHQQIINDVVDNI